MRCPSCGTEIQPGAAQCPSCGTPSTPEPFEHSGTQPYAADIESIPYVASSSLTETPDATSASSSSTTASSPPSVGSQAEQSQPAVQRPRMLRSTAVLLIILAALLIGGGGGFTAYATIIHSLELHAQATAVTQGILKEQALATANAQANSPQITYNHITSRTPSLSDPLDGLHASSWSNKGTGETGCVFTNGAYHLHIAPKDFYSYCLAGGSNYKNFLFQVQMTVIKGLDGGIVFRTADPSFPSYVFTITYNGLYSLNVSFSTQGGRTLAFGRSLAINNGLNQVNLLGVLALNDTISLFINKHFVTSVSDDTHSSGAIGLITSNFPRSSIDVAFNNAQVWNLP